MFYLARIHCECGNENCPVDKTAIVNAEEGALLLFTFMKTRHPAADNSVSVSEDTGTVMLRSDEGDYIVLEPLTDDGTVN